MKVWFFATIPNNGARDYRILPGNAAVRADAGVMVKTSTGTLEMTTNAPRSHRHSPAEWRKE